MRCLQERTRGPPISVLWLIFLEFLFCPPLELPRYEFSDADVRNRRDILFENPGADGFWAQIRGDYSAHYIVVDAKNYAKPAPKSSVLDIAHYLKPMVAVCSRSLFLVVGRAALLHTPLANSGLADTR